MNNTTKIMLKIKEIFNMFTTACQILLTQGILKITYVNYSWNIIAPLDCILLNLQNYKMQVISD